MATIAMNAAITTIATATDIAGIVTMIASGAVIAIGTTTERVTDHIPHNLGKSEGRERSRPFCWVLLQK
jgi:hypothetical protein